MRKILLSIKPQFVEQILEGSKQVEYRKRVPHGATGMRVLIYCSAPVKKVVAEFTVGEIISSTPEKIWESTSNVGGISKEELLKYFEKKDTAFAYKIENLRIFESPRLLSYYGVARAPQDFQYINDNL